MLQMLTLISKKAATMRIPKRLFFISGTQQKVMRDVPSLLKLVG